MRITYLKLTPEHGSALIPIGWGNNVLGLHGLTPEAFRKIVSNLVNEARPV